MNGKNLKWLIIAKKRSDDKLWEAEGTHKILVNIDGEYKEKCVTISQRDIVEFLKQPTQVPTV